MTLRIHEEDLKNGWAHWHCRWKEAGHLSQQMSSPPSLHASQESLLCPLPGLLKYGCRFSSLSLLVLLDLESSDTGGAISAWICCEARFFFLLQSWDGFWINNGFNWSFLSFVLIYFRKIRLLTGIKPPFVAKPYSTVAIVIDLSFF